jgi:hypothetical protein
VVVLRILASELSATHAVYCVQAKSLATDLHLASYASSDGQMSEMLETRGCAACVLRLSAGSHEWIGFGAFAAVFLEA